MASSYQLRYRLGYPSCGFLPGTVCTVSEAELQTLRDLEGFSKLVERGLIALTPMPGESIPNLPPSTASEAGQGIGRMKATEAVAVVRGMARDGAGLDRFIVAREQEERRPGKPRQSVLQAIEREVAGIDNGE